MAKKMHNPTYFQVHSDVISSVAWHETGCSPEAGQFSNGSSSRISLAPNDYLAFGSCTDSTWVNNILEVILEIASTSGKCRR